MLNLEDWSKQEFTGMNPGLSRIKKFLEIVGNPQKKLSIVHIAGTNGKGSTARIISSIIESAGYKAGLFTSPHIVSLNERIRVNSKKIGQKELDRLVKEYSSLGQKCQLSFFEFITGIAYSYFAKRKVDIAVIETGLGGRFDATNAISDPLVSVITDVDFDHEKILGCNLKKIAFEKAGIIKRGCTVVCGVENKSAAHVINETAKKKKSQILIYGKDFNSHVESVNWNKGYQRLLYSGIELKKKIRLNLLGVFQQKNCALAIAVSEVLSSKGFEIGINNIIEAVRSVSWPGRFDVREITEKSGRFKLVIDGAHNPGALRSFSQTWVNSPWGKKRRNFIFGVLNDKNYSDIIKQLSPLVENIFLVPVNSERALSLDRMRDIWLKYLPQNRIMLSDSVKDAFNKVFKMKDRIIGVTGSLYLIGELVRYLKNRS